MSRIFANNVRATAISNMVADVGALITFQTDGTKALNTSALKAYIDAQLLLVGNGSDGTPAAPATLATVQAALRNINVQAFVDKLNNATRKERFMGRADWPRSYGTVTGDYLVGAIKTAIAEAKSLADIVTAH
jgi:hypothetical protein